jgi:hypothetical protein
MRELVVVLSLLCAAPARAAISFVGEGTRSDEGQPSLPQGTSSGDVLVVVAGGNAATPPGWTQQVNHPYLRVFWKRAASSESTPSFGAGIRSVMRAYRGVVSSGNPFEATGAVGGGALEYSSGEYEEWTRGAPPGISTSTANAWVLQAAAGFIECVQGDYTIVDTLGDYRGGSGSGRRWAVGFAQWAMPAAGATGTTPEPVYGYFDSTQGWFMGASVLLALTPAAPPSVPSVPGPITAPLTNGTGYYTIAWGASTELGTGGYHYEIFENDAYLTLSGPTSVGVTARRSGTYRYRVRACNVSGCSAFTAEHTVTVAIEGIAHVGSGSVGYFLNYAGPVQPGLPPGVQRDDLLLLTIVGWGTPAPGWNFLASGSWFRVYWRRATGIEDAPVILDDWNGTAAAVAAFSGVVATGDPFEAMSPVVTGPGWAASLGLPSITTSTDGAVVVATAASLDFDPSYNCVCYAYFSQSGPYVAEAYHEYVDDWEGQCATLSLNYGLRPSAGDGGLPP